MALDRYDDRADVPGEAMPEQLRHHGSRADVPAGQAEPAELRSRLEYYEALRADDNRPDPGSDADRAAMERTRWSGWDALDAGNRPPRDALHVPAERSGHILDGEPGGGGGHRHGTGSPGKTEFPAAWDDKKIISNTLDVARRPDYPPVHQHWNDRWLCGGTRDGVEVSVVVLRSGEVWTAWPEEGGPGVIRNPRKETS